MPKVSDQHRAARREQIIDAMLRCVSRQGFHKTTMADVVAESGLSAGSVYLYFSGKDDLVRAIVETVVSEGVAGLVDDPAGRVLPPHRVLEALLTRLVALGEERGVDLHRVALQGWAEAARDPEIRAIYRREGIRGRAAWAGYAARAVEAGHLPPDADPDQVAQILIGLIPGYMVQRLVLEDLTPASYAAGLVHLLGTRATHDPG